MTDVPRISNQGAVEWALVETALTAAFEHVPEDQHEELTSILANRMRCSPADVEAWRTGTARPPESVYGRLLKAASREASTLTPLPSGLIGYGDD